MTWNVAQILMMIEIIAMGIPQGKISLFFNPRDWNL